MNFKLSSMLCCFLITTFTALSQGNETDAENVARVTILNPGLSYEARIARFQTVCVQGFMNISGYFSYSNALGTHSKLYFDPAADLQYRYYYNGLKRLEMEKRTGKNSMNYVTLMTEFIFSKMRLSDNYLDESTRRAISRLGVGWGLQRNYQKHFSLDLNFGFGYLISKETQYDAFGQTTTRNISSPTFMGQLNIGFWLGREKG